MSIMNLFKKKLIQVEVVINGRASSKGFYNNEQVQRYINSELIRNDLQVVEEINKSESTEYYCNDHSRFIVHAAI